MKRLIIGLFVALAGAAAVEAAAIASWGRDYSGLVSDTPNGNDFIAIAAGGAHSMALKSDRSIVSWGSDSVPFIGYSGVVSDTPTGDDFTAIC